MELLESAVILLDDNLDECITLAEDLNYFEHGLNKKRKGEKKYFYFNKTMCAWLCTAYKPSSRVVELSDLKKELKSEPKEELMLKNIKTGVVYKHSDQINNNQFRGFRVCNGSLSKRSSLHYYRDFEKLNNMKKQDSPKVEFDLFEEIKTKFPTKEALLNNIMEIYKPEFKKGDLFEYSEDGTLEHKLSGYKIPLDKIQAELGNPPPKTT